MPIVLQEQRRTRPKRAPTPEELGFVDEVAPPPPPPPKKRAPTPEELGLEVLPEQTPPEQTEPEADTSPDALGLAPTGPPPPTDGSWQDLWDWTEKTAAEAGDVVLGGLDWVRESLGFDEPPPEFPQDTSRRVPQENMNDKQDAVDWMIDMVVPDVAYDYLFKPVYDFATSQRTRQNVYVGADKTMGGLVIPAVRGLTKGARALDRALDQIGIDLDYWGRSDAEKEQAWNETLAWMKSDADAFIKRAGQNQLPEDQRTVGDALTEMLPMIPVMLVGYGGAGAMLGPVGGFAAFDAMTAWGEDKSDSEIGWAAAKGAALGKVLEWANVLSRPLRVAVLAPAGGGMAYAEGASDVDIAANAIVFPVLGAMPKSGPIGTRYLKEHGVMPDIRDIGGHVRDLFGGTEPRARNVRDRTAFDLKKKTTEHNVEMTQESMRWQSELAEARQPREGDTPEIVQSRVAEVNRAHEERLEEMTKRHYNEEQPLRQVAEHAQRRWERAQHPFTVSWMEGPYMRNLHMYERDVVVANVESVKVLQKAQQDGDERMASGMARAAEIRKQAEGESDPVAKRRLNQLADHVEDEALRVTYQMRTQAEDLAEYRIELAEARASSARYELAEVMGRRNRVEARRALQMATDRDMQDAYRAGVRKITRGNRRARELLKKADEVVTRREAQLKRDGITEENPETNGVYIREMQRVYEIRDIYRETASFELYESHSTADFRISMATHAHEMALNPAEKPGVVGTIMEMLGLRRRKNQEEEYTSPDDAKKPEAPDGDKLPTDPIKPGPNFEGRYRALMEHSKKDPHLGKLQDRLDHALGMITRPEDVFPMINHIAKQYDYDPPSRRGKQTAKLRKKVAEELNMTSDEFLNSPYGKAFNDAELEAIIMILDRQWSRVQRSYEIWRNTGSNNAFMTYQAELYRFVMIWERVRGAAAESGRSLRMFREIKKKYGQVGRPLTDTEYNMIMSGDSKFAMRMLKSFENGGWWNMFIEYWVNNLLSGPATAMVNTLSGFTMLAYKSIIQPSVAAAIGLTHYGFQMTIGRMFRPVFRPLYRAMIRMFGSKSANARLDIDIENSKYGYDLAETRALKHRVRLGEVGARVRGLIEGIGAGVFAFFKTLFTGKRFQAESSYAVGAGDHIPWWLGGPIIRIPGRIMQAIDSFFQAIMYRSALRGHAYRLATAEYGYTGDVGWAGYRGKRQRYQELVKHPDAATIQAAKREALEATFQNPMGPEFSGVPGFVAKHPAMRIIMPFLKTPLNVLEFVLSGTPAAFLFRNARQSLLGMRGVHAQHMAMAHMLITTTSAYVIFLWALGGNVAAPYPKNEKGRTIQSLGGVPPLAVRIPGTKEWIQVNRIDPIGAVFALGASAAAAYKISTARNNKKDADRAWSIFWASVFSMITDRSGFKGLVDFFTAFNGGSSGNDYDSWTRWANKTMATAAVPQVIASWARAKDPVIRRAEGLIQQIMNRVPGEREKLPPVRNLWGDQVIGYDSYGDSDFLDWTMPVYWGRKSDDAATKAMVTMFEIYDWAPGPPKKEIAGRELTDEEYDYLQVQAGKYAHAGISELTRTPEWQRADALDRSIKRDRKIVERMERAARTPEDRKKAKAARRDLETRQEELRKLRYALLQRVKNIISDARERARDDTAGSSDGKKPGRFPGIWERERTRDDAANSGEEPDYLPDWLDAWFNAEDPTEEWEAAEDRRAGEYTGAGDGNPYTGGDPVLERERQKHRDWQEKNRAWIEQTRQVQAENERRRAQGLPPLPLPPKPPD
jgi:hypothetical protein